MTRIPWHRYAAHMLQGGYSPVPVHWGSKEPVARKHDERSDALVLRGLVNGWNRLRETPLSPEDIAGFCWRYAKLNIGVLGGFNSLVPIDFDTDDPLVLAACAKAVPRPNVAKAGRRGFVGFWRAAGELPRARKWLTPKRDGKPGKVLVEILTSTKTVLPPSMHPDTRAPYRWLTRGTLYTKPISNLVPITAEHIDALAAALRPWCPSSPAPKYRTLQPGEIVADKRMRGYALGTLRNEAKRLAGMSTDSGRNIRLFDAGCILGKYVHHKVLAAAEVEAALLDACKANGLIRDDGETQCLQTLRNGIKKAANDGLPALQYWGRSTR